LLVLTVLKVGGCGGRGRFKHYQHFCTRMPNKSKQRYGDQVATRVLLILRYSLCQFSVLPHSRCVACLLVQRDGTDVMQTAPLPSDIHTYHLLQYHVCLALALGASKEHAAVLRCVDRLDELRRRVADDQVGFDLLLQAAASEQHKRSRVAGHRQRVGEWEHDFFNQLRNEEELRLVERAADRAAEEFAEFLQVQHVCVPTIDKPHALSECRHKSVFHVADFAREGEVYSCL